MRFSRAAKAIRKLGPCPHLCVVLAKQMGIDVGEDSIWMTRSNQSPDPLDGQVCCSAFPSANSQLFETYNLVEKGDVLDSIDDDDDIE